MKKITKAFKDQLKKLQEKLLTAVFSLRDLFFKLALSFAIVLSFLYLASRAPEIHGLFLRMKVGEKVYRVLGGSNSGGGTGFSIKAKSGISYIVTNAHVCELSEDGQNVLIISDSGRYLRRRILQISDHSDLCLIEGIPGVEGLSMGSEPRIGDVVTSVGHPSSMPITLSKGEIIGTSTIKIPVGIIIDQNDPESNTVKFFIREARFLSPEMCTKPKHEVTVQTVNLIFLYVRLVTCLEVTVGAYKTNILIRPGNSGSPVVDFWGNVVGIVFASDNYNWGSVVSYRDLEKFLSNF